MDLQIQPELGLDAKVTAEAQGRVRSNGAFAVHDLIDAPRVDADVLGQTILADSHGVHEIFLQDLAGVDGGIFSSVMNFPFLMVVRDFHVVSVPLAPPEANAPLIVDTDTVLTVTHTAQCLEVVCRRSAKSVEVRAACMATSLRIAVRCMPEGSFKERMRLKSFSVSLQLRACP